MSLAHAQKFYEIASKDPGLVQKLTQGNKTADDFVAKIVAEAKRQGLEVSNKEASEFIQANLKDIKPGGELSDQQLESVAGGKITFPSGCLGANVWEGIGKGLGELVGYSWAWGP